VYESDDDPDIDVDPALLSDGVDELVAFSGVVYDDAGDCITKQSHF
jgi:hypothetical protein